MFDAVKNPYLVPFDSNVDMSSFTTEPPEDLPSKGKLKKELCSLNEKLHEIQRVLFGHHKYSVLLIFQGMDASGKDSAIRKVLSGINPAGCQVYAFGPPSQEDKDHDFLWRTAKCLPERGRIGVFNRSYYEEVLIVRVHPGYLVPQNLPDETNMESIWDERLESICDHEKHLARNGVIVMKFWLNISRQEQKKRLLSRLDNPEKNWKFEEADVKERRYWDDYMNAYQSILSKTSKSWAPWYAIPSDNKTYARVCIAETILERLKTLDLYYPKVEEDAVSSFDEMREHLKNDTD